MRERQKNEGLCVDVGCGEHPLYEHSIHVDLLPFNHVEHIVNVDRERLPFKDGCVDKIFCLEVVEHLENPTFFLNEAHRVLRKGGKLVLTTPDENSFVWRVVWFLWNRTFGKEWHHKSKFTLKQLNRFVVVDCAKVNFFLHYIEVVK